MKSTIIVMLVLIGANASPLGEKIRSIDGS